MTQSYSTPLVATIVCCLLFATALWTSCKKEPCANTTCLNGGTCHEGTCKCPDGYEGQGCEIKLPGLEGAWAGSYCGDSHDMSESLTITPSDSDGYMDITYTGYERIYGKQSGKSLHIDKQHLYPASSSGGFGVRYIEGTMENTRDTITYQFDCVQHHYYNPMVRIIPPDTFQCSGRYLRQ